MNDPKKQDEATLVAGDETQEIESRPPKRPKAPEGLSDDEQGTLVAGEETHKIEQGGADS